MGVGFHGRNVFPGVTPNLHWARPVLAIAQFQAPQGEAFNGVIPSNILVSPDWAPAYITLDAMSLAIFFSDILNANFTVAVIGGLTGSFAGAWGAQHIVERARRREEMLRELRSANAAIMVCFSVCNSALALKHQHVQPMYEQFDKENHQLQEFYRRRAAGELPPDSQFEFPADLRVFPAITSPMDTLKSLVFERISAYGRPLALLAVLDQSLIGLRETMEKRDHLVQRFLSGAVKKQEFPHYYFGLRLPSGDTNQEYSDTVKAIHSYTDDIIFFSSMLCSDLVKHGENIRAELVKTSGKNVPKVSKADFSGAKNLMPSEDEYTDWVKAFQSADIVQKKAGG
jgi:hypothetical protein